MMWLGWFLFTVTFAALVCAVWAISNAQEQVVKEKNIHEACHEATIEVLKTACRRTDASALRAAADRWDSVEEQHRIKLLSRDYAPGGPSMPAIWLRAEADRMDPALAEETVNG